MAMTGYTDGKVRAMGGRTRLNNSLRGDVPRPLHITKRSNLGRCSQITRNSRGCSPESSASDATMDSPPEPLGSGRPLALPKRRRSRGDWAMSHAVGCTGDKGRVQATADGRDPTCIEPCPEGRSAYAS